MDNFTQDLIDKLPFQLNNYHFIKYVSEGAYSVVFEVYSTFYNRTFAAKVTDLNENLICNNQLYDPELAALFSLDHPNVIKFYDYFVYETKLILILDFVRGGTLQKYVGTHLRPPILQQLVKNIVDGLNYCHQQQIAHRDLKPSNIFIDGDDHAIVGDFGLASFQDVVDSACGSPFYCAPEIFQKKPYDPYMADIFALGVTLYELIMGKVPFTENQLRNGISLPTVNVPICNSKLERLILEMLRFDPIERPTMKMIQNSEYLSNVIKKKGLSSSSLPRFSNISEERFNLNVNENIAICTFRSKAHFNISSPMYLKRRSSKIDSSFSMTNLPPIIMPKVKSNTLS